MDTNPIDSAAVQVQFKTALERSHCATEPYRHWFLEDVLPEAAGYALRSLPFDPPQIDDTEGRRETHNATRVFVSAENRARYPVCQAIAEALQDPATVERIERICDVDLTGSFLRIEYCQDTDGFWLEPHTDIGAKLFTMLIYLSTEPESESWGTDIFDAAGDHVATAPCAFNSGLIFVPGNDTWHGFRKRPITGVRQSIIVNYVKDEWRARHELAYPETPVD